MTDFIPHGVQFTGRKMLIIITSFFFVIIAVNGTMLTLAVKTFGGLVVGNSYVASQHFNDDIAAAKAQPIREWDIDLVADPAQIAVTMRDRDGAVLSGLDMTLSIARPTHQRSTTLMTLTESAPGLYTTDASIEPGQWLGTLKTADGQTRSLYFVHKKTAS